jgi:mono/diheme cytochrome c family protein
MSEHAPQTKPNRPPRSCGVIAEYSEEHQLLEAANKVREAGYTKTDAFTPYPVHGIDRALGIKPTILPFIVLCGGLTGLATALTMQYWMNVVDYPYIISGKPFRSWPAFIPVTFELTVLFSAITTFLGSIALNRLPKFSNPVFTSPRFDRATDDRFFLFVDSQDKYYNKKSVEELLNATHPESLEEVKEDSTPSNIPRPLLLCLALVVIAGLIPAALVFKMRNGMDPLPRWHVFFDMDFQPKKKPQQISTIFADGRAMRPQVAGTVARGQLEQADPFYLGYDPSELAMSELQGVKLVSASQEPAKSDDNRVVNPVDGQPPAPQSTEAGATQQPSTEPAKTETETPPSTDPAPVVEQPAQQPAAADPAPAAGATPAPGAPASGVPNLPFVKQIPMEVTDAAMDLGKQKFEIYCAACHGVGGDGDGLVARRADELAQGYWLAPTSMHSDAVRKQAVGQIFYTITNGKGKMASYGAVLTPKERWAIVLYVRALQRSRNADLDDVPEDQRGSLAKGE